MFMYLNHTHTRSTIIHNKEKSCAFIRINKTNIDLVHIAHIHRHTKTHTLLDGK